MGAPPWAFAVVSSMYWYPCSAYWSCCAWAEPASDLQEGHQKAPFTMEMTCPQNE